MILDRKIKLDKNGIKFNCAMIIDDNEIDIFVSKQMIELCDFSNKIIAKKNCAEALDFLSECKRTEELPDFIFLDLFMPLQNGYDFLESYSKKSKMIKNKCKIIVLSVLLNEDAIQELLKNPNVYTLLQKPLTEESLSALKEIHYIQSQRIRKVSEIHN